MAKDKKADKAKAKTVTGPRKAGKHKTVKTIQGSLTAAPVKKLKKVVCFGPSCSFTCLCKFAKMGGLKNEQKRQCSLGFDIQVGGNCNFAKWGKKMRSSDLHA